MPATNVSAVRVAALSLFLSAGLGAALSAAAEPAPKLGRFAPIAGLAGRSFVGEMPEA